jgi:hypothetical protein
MPFDEGINTERNVYMHEENGQKKLYIYAPVGDTWWLRCGWRKKFTFSLLIFHVF